MIDSLLKAEEIDSTIDKVERNIVNNGGEILKVDRWGKKRLAYEIKKRQYGYYVEILFKSVGDIIKIIEREYGLDENLLRYLTLKLDKKAVAYYESKLNEASKKEVQAGPETDKTNDDKVTPDDEKDEKKEDEEMNKEETQLAEEEAVTN
ncbi:30S ribosomal protein S6 [candidate division KSB1 bacterium]|nr:30S ribosomal protein S6 [candidate division KSB1 bacterium]